MKTPLLLLAALMMFVFASPLPVFADDYDSLPPRVIVKTEADAIRLAGTNIFPVKGTGSMKPYIPESDDPDKVVAILAVDNPPYEDLKKGDLVVFRLKEAQVVHQIAAAQGDKWITSGLDNSRYDGPALTRETFVSRVVKVYVIEANASSDTKTEKKSDK